MSSIKDLQSAVLCMQGVVKYGINEGYTLWSQVGPTTSVALNKVNVLAQLEHLSKLLEGLDFVKEQQEKKGVESMTQKECIAILEDMSKSVLLTASHGPQIAAIQNALAVLKGRDPDDVFTLRLPDEGRKILITSRQDNMHYIRIGNNMYYWSSSENKYCLSCQKGVVEWAKCAEDWKYME